MLPKTRLQPALQQALAPPSLRRAVAIASVVGPVLTLVNQFGALRGAGEIALVPLILTFIVPFCVSLVATALSGASTPCPSPHCPFALHADGSRDGIPVPRARPYR